MIEISQKERENLRILEAESVKVMVKRVNDSKDECSSKSEEKLDKNDQFL
jgi:hypothetical protein